MNNVNFASYADNKPYVIVYGITQFIESFCWFVNNQMKANPDKRHFITSRDEVSICVENYSITSSKYEKRLDIKVDTKLNFTNYIDEI